MDQDGPIQEEEVGQSSKLHTTHGGVTLVYDPSLLARIKALEEENQRLREGLHYARSPITKLPPELFVEIASFLSIGDLSSFSRTCRDISQLLTPLLYGPVLSRLMQNFDDRTIAGYPIRPLIPPIHDAVMKGNIDAASALLERGRMDVDLQWTKSGKLHRITDGHDKLSPLHMALMMQDEKMTQYLLDKGASMDVLCEKNIMMTGLVRLGAVLVACRCGSIELLKLLLARGASLDVTDGCGRNPIASTLSETDPRSWSKIIDFLLEKGVDPLAPDNSAETPLSLGLYRYLGEMDPGEDSASLNYFLKDLLPQCKSSIDVHSALLGGTPREYLETSMDQELFTALGEAGLVQWTL